VNLGELNNQLTRKATDKTRQHGGNNNVII